MDQRELDRIKTKSDSSDFELLLNGIKAEIPEDAAPVKIGQKITHIRGENRDAFEFVAQNLNLGVRTPMIKKVLVEEFGFAKEEARVFITNVRRDVLGEMKAYIENIWDENLKRAYGIYEKAIQKEDYKLALQTLDMINKMSGVYIINEKRLENAEPQEIEYEIVFN